MPDWDGLGRAVAADIPAFEYSGALDALSAYSHEYGRTRLVEELRRSLLVDEAQPGAVHTAFCRIPFEIVFTTNFDFLLERGYGLVRRSCTPVTGEDQLTIGPKGASVRVVKLHGDLNHPEKLVVVEQDYDATLQKYPLIVRCRNRAVPCTRKPLTGFCGSTPPRSDWTGGIRRTRCAPRSPLRRSKMAPRWRKCRRPPATAIPAPRSSTTSAATTQRKRIAPRKLLRSLCIRLRKAISLEVC
jgi:hypothetical protein